MAHRLTEIADAVEHFTARAARYDQSSRWCTDPALGALLLQMMQPQPQHHHLDVACGTGLVSALFHGRVARVVGLDITAAMMEQARPHLDALVVSSAEQMPFADGTFDSVSCRQGIQFMDDAAAVAEMVRVTRPGGRVGLVHLCAYGPEDAEDYFEVLRLRNPARRNFYLREDLVALLQGAGCSSMELRTYVSDEDVGAWADNGAIEDGRQRALLEVYRRAGADFLRLHGVRLEEGGRVMDRMLFAVVVGIK
jgi:SAM-dependent methyltransferase